MILKAPPSTFTSCLIRINNLNLCGFDRFVFFNGMLFGSKEKWWGAKGVRESIHEGLDLCFFLNKASNMFRLDETVRVPMLYDGVVEHITDDFLGKTVIMSHHFEDRNQRALLSFYGHMNPDKNLKIGDKIKEGEAFASIAGIADRKKGLLPHLHISLARPDMLPPADSLEWEFLNRADRSVFVNPIDAISVRYTVIEYDDRMNLSESFSLWRHEKLKNLTK